MTKGTKLRFILLIPLYLVLRFVLNIILEIILRVIHYEISDQWIIFATDFLVIFLAISLSLELIPFEKRKTGLTVLLTCQCLLLLTIIGSTLILDYQNFSLIRSTMFVLVSLLPFIAFYKKEIE